VAGTDSPRHVKPPLRRLEAAPGWVVQRAGGQHGDEDVEQAVHDATYRARMTMPAGAQTFVVRATDRIMAGGGLAPMVRRLAQPRIARVAHADQGAAPALTSDGCHAGLRPQPVVISGRQQPRGFGEHRGGDDSPDAHHGPEDRHVTMLLTLPQAFQQPLDLRGALRPLLMDQPQARQEHRQVTLRGLDRPCATGSAGARSVARTASVSTRRMR